MSPDVIFQYSNILALSGWLLLLASPFIPKIVNIGTGAVIPLLLAIAYTGLLFAFWSNAEGGFDSLENVMKLFMKPEIVLAGWIHYLAFDLFVGCWEVRTAREEKIPFLLVIPCLFFTFMFGPAGFLMFTALRICRAYIASPQTA